MTSLSNIAMLLPSEEEVAAALRALQADGAPLRACPDGLHHPLVRDALALSAQERLAAGVEASRYERQRVLQGAMDLLQHVLLAVNGGRSRRAAPLTWRPPSHGQHTDEPSFLGGAMQRHEVTRDLWRSRLPPAL